MVDGRGISKLAPFLSMFSFRDKKKLVSQNEHFVHIALIVCVRECCFNLFLIIIARRMILFIISFLYNYTLCVIYSQD